MTEQQLDYNILINNEISSNFNTNACYGDNYMV